MTATLRVMSTNLRGGLADADAYRNLLGRFDPDLVVTQELGHAQAEVLAARFDHHHLLPAEEFHGRGIATKFNAEFDDVPMPGRPGTSALIEIGNTTWQFLGIHLLNPVMFPHWTMVRERGRQLEAIEGWGERISEPGVVVGDFNASPRWPAYRRMARSWDDLVAHLAADQHRSAERTWSWRPGWPRLLRIDHVFGRGVTAINVCVARITGSDHWAVVVDLSERSAGS